MIQIDGTFHMNQLWLHDTAVELVGMKMLWYVKGVLQSIEILKNENQQIKGKWNASLSNSVMKYNKWL